MGRGRVKQKTLRGKIRSPSQQMSKKAGREKRKGLGLKGEHSPLRAGKRLSYLFKT